SLPEGGATPLRRRDRREVAAQGLAPQDVKPEATTIAERTRIPRFGTSPQHREAEDRCPDQGQGVERRQRRVWGVGWLFSDRGRCEPIDRPEAEPEQGQKFEPRAYTPEDLAVIEQALKLTLAGASTPTEPDVIPPGAR